MIDLHCHLLPGIDDGAADLPTALRMARIGHLALSLENLQEAKFCNYERIPLM